MSEKKEDTPVGRKHIWATRGACDQTSADTEEAKAEIPQDETSALEKNMRKQAVQGGRGKKEAESRLERMEDG